MSQWFGGYWTNALDGQPARRRRRAGAPRLAPRRVRQSSNGSSAPIIRIRRATASPISTSTRHACRRPGWRSSARCSAATCRTPTSTTASSTSTSPPTSTTRQWGVSSTLSYDFDGGTIRLINSYRDWQNDQLDGDVIFTPLPIVSRVGNYSSKSHNHELQFLSPTGVWLDGLLDLIAGLYYFSEDYRLDEQLQHEQHVLQRASSRPVRGAPPATTS